VTPSGCKRATPIKVRKDSRKVVKEFIRSMQLDYEIEVQLKIKRALMNILKFLVFLIASVLLWKLLALLYTLAMFELGFVGRSDVWTLLWFFYCIFFLAHVLIFKAIDRYFALHLFSYWTILVVFILWTAMGLARQVF
jgi:hypothetical protein